MYPADLSGTPDSEPCDLEGIALMIKQYEASYNEEMQKWLQDKVKAA